MVALILISLPHSVRAWVPHECPSDFFATQDKLHKALSAATPDKWFSFPPVTTYVHYVPYPFPQIDEQVVADYRYGFELITDTYRGDFSHDPAKQTLAQLLKTPMLTYTVHRVENWSAYDFGRCSRDTLSRFIFIIRFADKQTGKEIQAQVNELGLVYWSELNQPDPLPDIAATIKAAHEYGIEAARDAQAQLVAVNTQNTYPAEDCDLLWPCVAFKGVDGSVYILLRPSRGLFGKVKAPESDWYQVSPKPDLRSTEQVADWRSFTLPAISFGHLQWAVARRVPKKTLSR